MLKTNCTFLPFLQNDYNPFKKLINLVSLLIHIETRYCIAYNKGYWAKKDEVSVLTGCGVISTWAYLWAYMFRNAVDFHFWTVVFMHIASPHTFKCILLHIDIQHFTFNNITVYLRPKLCSCIIIMTYGFITRSQFVFITI